MKRERYNITSMEEADIRESMMNDLIRERFLDFLKVWLNENGANTDYSCSRQDIGHRRDLKHCFWNFEILILSSEMDTLDLSHEMRIVVDSNTGSVILCLKQETLTVLLMKPTLEFATEIVIRGIFGNEDFKSTECKVFISEDSVILKGTQIFEKQIVSRKPILERHSDRDQIHSIDNWPPAQTVPNLGIVAFPKEPQFYGSHSLTFGEDEDSSHPIPKTDKTPPSGFSTGDQVTGGF